MECSLVGEQEQRHSAGTDIVDYGRCYLLWKLTIYRKKFEPHWLRAAVQFLINTVQKRGNTNVEREITQISR